MSDPTPPLPTDAVTDQDVDTAGTDADDERAAREGRRDDPSADRARAAGDQQPRSPNDPGTMHRAEDDAAAQAGSRDFSEQPDRATSQPPRRSDS